MAELDVLENLPEDIELVRKRNKKELEELLHSKHFEGFKEKWLG